MDPETRARVSAAGGRARQVGLRQDPHGRAAFAAAGGRAVNSPVGLALRLARAWPALGVEERAAVREALGSVLADGDVSAP